MIDYKIRKDRMHLTHSEVPVKLRGNGIGKVLVEKSLEKLVEEGYDKNIELSINVRLFSELVVSFSKRTT